jgi:acylglycerol lipase
MGRFRLIALLASATLAFAMVGGCAPVIVGAGPPTATPSLTSHEIITRDGARLPLRRWDAAGHPKAIILGLHGFNDYSKSFTEPAEAWTRAGLSVYAYDQRGFGAAPGWGYWHGAKTLAEDLEDVSHLIRARHPKLPLILVGESMGAAVILAADAGPTPPSADGYVLSAPAIWSRDTMPFYQRAALWIGAHTAPWLRLTGRGLNIRASDNNEMLRKLGRDPLVIKGARVDALYGLTNLMDRAHAAAANLKTPTLILYGDDEQLIPAPARETFLAQLPRDGKWRYGEYPTGFHMLMRDLNADIVLRDIAAWTMDNNTALPSGADQAKGAQRWARAPCPAPHMKSQPQARPRAEPKPVQIALAC